MKKYIIILFSFVIMTSFLFSGDEWKYEKTRKGIEIYSTKYEDSKIKMFKGVTIINSGVEVLSEVLKRPSSYAEFLYRCKKSIFLKQFSEFDIMAYNLTNLPWPIKDREIVVRSHLKKDFKKGVFTITIKNIPLDQYEKYIEINKKYKLMQKAISIFILEIIDRNTTKVTYMAYADPGGLSPNLVNFDAVNTPYKTLVKLKKIAKEKKFIKAAEKAKKMPALEIFFRNLEKINK